MKFTKRDLIGGLYVALPFILFMFPLMLDTMEGINNQKAEVKIVVSSEMPSMEVEDVELKGMGEESHTIYIMKTVAYCSCEKCCGWNTGITYSGTVATQGRTVACNLDKFPIGTKLMIDGHEYIVEDTGHLSENMIDIYFDSHEAALQYGSQWKAVEVVE